MGLSRELYDLVLLIFKPTEGTSKFLDLILNVFTARVKTFEPLSHSSHLSHAADHKLYLTSLK